MLKSEFLLSILISLRAVKTAAWVVLDSAPSIYLVRLAIMYLGTSPQKHKGKRGRATLEYGRADMM